MAKFIEGKEPDIVNDVKSVSAGLRDVLLSCADLIQRSFKRPTEVEKVFIRPFVVSKNDIKNIYDLVEQRLENDNDKIISKIFSIDLLLTQENRKTFPTIEEFMSYNETKPIIPTTVSLNWKIVLNFNDPNNQLENEKQEISVLFSKPGFDFSNDEQPILIFKNRSIVGTSAIIISVETTNRIWALDFVNHLEGYIESNIEKPDVPGKLKMFYTYRKRIFKYAKMLTDLIEIALLLLLAFSLNTYIAKNVLGTAIFGQIICNILYISSFIVFTNGIYMTFIKKGLSKFDLISLGLIPRSSAARFSSGILYE